MKKSLLLSFDLIGKIGISVCLPLIAFGLLGRFLDKKFDTNPYLFLLGLASATLVICFIIKNIVKTTLREFEENQKK